MRTASEDIGQSPGQIVALLCLEMVDALRQNGAAPREDIHALWRRIVFNVLISNTDDHLRNHGFLHAEPAGWRLAPACDLNPVPIDIGPRALATAIDLDDGTASLQLALSVASYFELDEKTRVQSPRKWGARSRRGARKQRNRASISQTSTVCARRSSTRTCARRVRPQARRGAEFHGGVPRFLPHKLHRRRL